MAFFNPFALNLLEVNCNHILFKLKKELIVLPLTLRVSYNCNFDIFRKFKLINYTKSFIFLKTWKTIYRIDLFRNRFNIWVFC